MTQRFSTSIEALKKARSCSLLPMRWAPFSRKDQALMEKPLHILSFGLESETVEAPTALNTDAAIR